MQQYCSGVVIMVEEGDIPQGQHAPGDLPNDTMNAPLPPPPPLPADMEIGGLPGPPLPDSHPAAQAPLPEMPPMPLPDDMDMELDAGHLPPPPPPPPPQDPSMAPFQAADPASTAPLPPPPITLPAPANVEPAQQHAEPQQQLVNASAHAQRTQLPLLLQQGGEMSEEQYNAMTPEQQAAYWHQWQQYSQQYYAAAADPQQDPSLQYTQDLQSQAQYGQYQYGQPDAQQWAQYAAQPQQQYAEQQPDYSYYYQQQQAQHGAPGQAQLQGLSQPYPPQVHYSAAPDSSAAYGYQAAALPAAAYGAGLGVSLEVPVLAPPKKAVPDWLRAEMLKRGLGQSAQAAPKQGSDSEPEPDQAQPRRLAQAGGSRWAGDEERGGQRGVGGDDSSDEEAEEKVSRAEELRRERLGAVVKRNLTGILLEVTDALFEEIAKKALSGETEDPQGPKQEATEAEPPVVAKILQDSDDSEESGKGGNALGLGYGSEEGSDSETEGKQDKYGKLEASETKQGSSVPAQLSEAAEKKPSNSAHADSAAGSLALSIEDESASELDQAGLSQTQALHSSSKAEDVPKAEPTADSVSVKQEAAESLSTGDSKAGSAVAAGGAGGAAVAEAADKTAGLANGNTCKPKYSKGSSVWYMDRHQQRQPAVVVAVDVMHPPPSYCIRLEGADSTRDTEEARLEPRAAQPLPEPAQPAPEAQSAAAKPEGVDGATDVPTEQSLPEARLNSSNAEVSASKAASAKEESKKKRKEREKERQRDTDDSKKHRSSRDEDRPQKQDNKQDDRDKKGRKASKDEGKEKDKDSKRDRGRDDRKRQRSSRSLSRSRSRDRRRRQRSPSRDRRRDSDRRRSSISPSRERRRRRSDSRSPASRKHKSESRKDRRSRKESD